ncbi:MAG: methyltransferase domain-containing protein [Treponema sp.]|nr:methyltransferase domain-containing protein [Treponema sp.]
MSLRNIFDRKKKRTVVIVQCRLSSTRLPRKALLPLGGKPLVEWTLAAMKKVKADAYYLATDVDSGPELEGIARAAGFSFYAGARDDVLDRFLKTIELSKADVVVRATADNPFLFYEAATALLDEYRERASSAPVDYISWTGLPHGSGVEIFNAHSLIEAASRTDDPYDHEHVGPALYRHTDRFNCLFLRAPKEFYYPELRTTVDVYADYWRALAVVDAVVESSGKVKEPVKEPFTLSQILAALGRESIKYPMLLVPCVEKGHGTGHLRRCLSLAVETGADILIPEDGGLAELPLLLDEYRGRGLKERQIVRNADHAECYSLAVTDLFSADGEFAKALSAKCPVVALDEGTADAGWADYLLDVIPSVQDDRSVNLSQPDFIPLPENRRTSVDRNAVPKTAIVVLGGEDPASLSLPAAVALASCGISASCVASSEAKAESLRESVGGKCPGVTVSGPVVDLKEKLYLYDLVVTHYGFTAFEARAAGCAVILMGTSPLHERLAEKYGFACVPASGVNEGTFKALLGEPGKLYAEGERGAETDGQAQEVGRGGMDLSAFVRELSHGKRLSCPVCRTFPEQRDPVVARTKARTFRRCASCGMLYMSWTVDEKQTEYNRAYFYEDYEKQYGKTYEEDFASIKAQGVRRMSLIDSIYRRHHSSVTPTILDVGCALGPFMDAANDSGWQVFGIDVSQDAVSHVTGKLHYPAICTSFPDPGIGSQFGMDRFDALTMWYVIEHFQDLDAVLSAVSSLVKKGGIFAFSTPSASGVSARYNKDKFFEQSPADHYTLWEPSRAASILKKYGFAVKKIVSTGIHPERFPESKRKLSPQTLAFASRVFKLGDTFEIYCRKE